jgi:23S rRNA pseudouridine1911/1915/1917 synthase
MEEGEPCAAHHRSIRIAVTPLWDILLEDGPLIAVTKPPGLPTQGVPTTAPSLETQVKAYLKRKYAKPGNVYLGVPHRLDRPVSGVVVFARNSKAAARLAEQFRLRQVRKWYLAVVDGLPVPEEGTLTDWLLKVPDQALAHVVPEGTPGAKRAALRYRVLQTLPKPGTSPGQSLSLVLIELETGRMHQIRVQVASRGWPIIGDQRYGSSLPFPNALGPDIGGAANEIIALHAARLDLRHPIRYDPISLIAPLPASWSAFGFDAVDMNPFERRFPEAR